MVASTIADNVREWLIAAGTVGAVFAAILATVFAERLTERRERSNRPSLDLGRPPDAVTVEDAFLRYDGVQGMGTAAYLRLSATAATGRLAPDEVEVLLANIRQTKTPLPDITIGYPGFQWTHADGATRLTIPPGVTRYVDLAWIQLRGQDSSGKLIHGDRKLRLIINPEPADMRNVLEPGDYELDLVVSARNADARYYRLDLSWDGNLGADARGDEIANHVVVGAPRPIAPGEARGR
jgi:hypothetical protein